MTGKLRSAMSTQPASFSFSSSDLSLLLVLARLRAHRRQIFRSQAGILLKRSQKERHDIPSNVAITSIAPN